MNTPPPVPGDIVVWGGGYKGYGHVSVVDANSGGLLTVVEQNSSPTGYGANPISASGYIAPSAYGYYVEGFLHAHADHIVDSRGGIGSAGVTGAGGAGYEMSFQANTGNLIEFGSAGNVNTTQGMMPGTSPSIAALPGGGYEMAFQANTGNLIVYGTAGNTNTQQGMKAGTSPSIAASPQGGFQVAFQANTGNLYTYNSASGPANLQQGMDNNTSPSIAP